MPLYDVKDPYEKAMTTMSQASGTYRGIPQGSKSVTTGPGPTVGGGIGAAAGGALAGAMYGAMEGTAVTPGIGTLIGAGVGLLSYFLS